MSLEGLQPHDPVAHVLAEASRTFGRRDGGGGSLEESSTLSIEIVSVLIVGEQHDVEIADLLCSKRRAAEIPIAGQVGLADRVGRACGVEDWIGEKPQSVDLEKDCG